MNYIMLKISTKLELSFFPLRFLMHAVNLIIGTQKPKKKRTAKPGKNYAMNVLQSLNLS